jgi:hypothetical protein
MSGGGGGGTTQRRPAAQSPSRLHAPPQRAPSFSPDGTGPVGHAIPGAPARRRAECGGEIRGVNDTEAHSDGEGEEGLRVVGQPQWYAGGGVGGTYRR